MAQPEKELLEPSALEAKLTAVQLAIKDDLLRHTRWTVGAVFSTLAIIVTVSTVQVGGIRADLAADRARADAERSRHQADMAAFRAEAATDRAIMVELLRDIERHEAALGTRQP